MRRTRTAILIVVLVGVLIGAGIIIVARKHGSESIVNEATFTEHYSEPGVTDVRTDDSNANIRTSLLQKIKTLYHEELQNEEAAPTQPQTVPQSTLSSNEPMAVPSMSEATTSMPYATSSLGITSSSTATSSMTVSTGTTTIGSEAHGDTNF